MVCLTSERVTSKPSVTVLRRHSARLLSYNPSRAGLRKSQLFRSEYIGDGDKTNSRQSVDNYLMIFDDIELGLALQSATSIPDRPRYWSLDRALATA